VGHGATSNKHQIAIDAIFAAEGVVDVVVVVVGVFVVVVADAAARAGIIGHHSVVVVGGVVAAAGFIAVIIIDYNVVLVDAVRGIVDRIRLGYLISRGFGQFYLFSLLFYSLLFVKTPHCVRVLKRGGGDSGKGNLFLLSETRNAGDFS
jgi:hypothetical protein